VKGLLGRIGGGGLAAIAALAIAGGVIGYRLIDASGEDAPDAAQPGDPLAELERRAAAEPDNAGAWQELGFAYFELGRFADAATAYERATEADPDSAVLWSSLGEALVMASERDPMPPAALQAFRKAIALDRGDPRGRYFMAVEKDLAASLGVSRNTLREAVRALSSLKVLQTRQGDGTYVTSLQPDLLLDGMGFVADLHRENGELDFVEYTNPDAQKAGAWLHYPHKKGIAIQQAGPFEKNCDMTQWHNFAFEWDRTGVRGWIDGEPWCEVKDGGGLKVPQIGWNQIELKKPDCPIFKGIEPGSYVYFVHSFYPEVQDRSIIATETVYGHRFPTAVWKDKFYATQFHPGRSGTVGLELLANFPRVAAGLVRS
jgi:Flp pilus assembly protein TadD